MDTKAPPTALKPPCMYTAKTFSSSCLNTFTLDHLLVRSYGADSLSAASSGGNSSAKARSSFFSYILCFITRLPSLLPAPPGSVPTAELRSPAAASVLIVDLSLVKTISKY